METIRRRVERPFDEVLARIPEVLREEGFGIVTQMDLQKIFAEKLGTPFRRYRVLGACNPGFAHRAVSEHPEVGVLLPCNVVVYETEQGFTDVIAVDPMAQLAKLEHDLSDLTVEVKHRLEKALENL